MKFFVWKYSYFRYLQKIVVNKWVGYRQVNLQKMSVSITSENEPAEMAEKVEPVFFMNNDINQEDGNYLVRLCMRSSVVIRRE